MSRAITQLVNNVGQLNKWRDSLNPLRSLTMPRAVNMMEQGQRGIYADLQWTYAAETGLEATDTDLMVIIERTLSFLSDCAWSVKTIDPETDGFDAKLSEDQAAYLKSVYNTIDNIEDALQHLCMARFRGYAHVQPWYSPTDNALVQHLEILPQWNMVRNGPRGAWAWNPEAQQIPFESVPAKNHLAPEDYIAILNPRPVNRIGLIKYIRATVAEKDWDGYVEIYGLPGYFIIMPPSVPNGRESEYAAQAEAAAEAGSGALPAGSDVKTMSEVRGSQPFQPRLEWLQRQLVLAGTGGLLTMLAESGSGTLAGSVHQEAFATIGRRQARIISQAFQRQLDARLLALRFPGRPIQAYFELREKQETDVSEAIKNIALLSTAGFIADAAQVSEETGYDVTYQPPAAPTSPFASARARASTVHRPPSTVLQPSDPEASLRSSAATALLEAHAADAAPLAARIAAVLDAPDYATLQARAAALRSDLPAIARDMLASPSAATALEGTMVAAFFQKLASVTTAPDAIALAFDPGQPRDEYGRWTEGLGGEMSWLTKSGGTVKQKDSLFSVTSKDGVNKTYELTDVRPPNPTEALRLKKAGHDPVKFLVAHGPTAQSFHPAEDNDRLQEALKRSKSAAAKKAGPSAPAGATHDQYRTLRENAANHATSAFPGSPEWKKAKPHTDALLAFEAQHPDTVKEHKDYLAAKRTHELKGVDTWAN
jgi:phage gp29-like protein